MNEPPIVRDMKAHNYTPSGPVEYGADQHTYISPAGQTLTIQASGAWTLIEGSTEIKAGSTIPELMAYLEAK